MHSKFQDSPGVNWISFRKKKDSKPNFPEVLKTFMGRDALNIYLWNIKKNRKNLKALLPAYICKEVPEQFKRNKIEIKYYDISNFQLSLRDIEPFLNEDFDIFYFVHYFGMYQKNIEEIISILRQRNPDIIIIEDRAHYLTDEHIINDIDAIIYSFRKLLPIPEGGGVYSKQRLEYKLNPKLYSNILVMLVLLKKKIFGHNPKFSRSNVMKDSLKESNKLLPISTFSERVVNLYDLQQEKEFRKNLFYQWTQSIKHTKIEPVFEKIAEKDIPQGFPVYVGNAEKIFEKMLEKGIFLKRHWELSNEIKDIAPKSFNLSKKIITLPIYTGIEKNDILFIIENLEKLI